MTDSRRTAPLSWGAWPPTQQRVNAIVTRAARALADQLEAEGWEGVTILVAEPEDAVALDKSFVGIEQEIVVGFIRTIGTHRGFALSWGPASDTGRTHRVEVTGERVGHGAWHVGCLRFAAPCMVQGASESLRSA